MLAWIKSWLSAKQAHEWEATIRRFENTDKMMPPAKGGIVFVGSSTIGLWKWVGRSFPHTRIINRGFGGAQIEDLIYFVDRIIILHRPCLIIVYAGDNDIACGKTPLRVFEDFRKFVNKIDQQLPETRIAFISIKPSPARWHLINNVREANEFIRHYIAKKRRLTYIDIHTAMIGPNGLPHVSLFAKDGLHLNRNGYRLLRDIITPYLRESDGAVRLKD